MQTLCGRKSSLTAGTKEAVQGKEVSWKAVSKSESTYLRQAFSRSKMEMNAAWIQPESCIGKREFFIRYGFSRILCLPCSPVGTGKPG